MGKKSSLNGFVRRYIARIKSRPRPAKIIVAQSCCYHELLCCIEGDVDVEIHHPAFYFLLYLIDASWIYEIIVCNNRSLQRFIESMCISTSILRGIDNQDTI